MYLNISFPESVLTPTVYVFIFVGVLANLVSCIDSPVTLSSSRRYIE